jgi:peptidyl-prolyl cis-trans isomerase D
MAEPAQPVSRAQARGLPKPVIDAVLKAPTQPLPSVLGVDLGEQGYAVVRLVKVLGRDPVVGAPAQAQQQYGQAWADAEAQAYYTALKQRFKVDIGVAAPPAASAPSQ